MDGADGNVAGKRRFPSWMLGVATPEKVKEPREGAVNGDLADAPVLKVRKTVSRTLVMDSIEDGMLKEKELDEETSIVAESERKRKRISRRKVKEAATQRRVMKKNVRLQSIQESDELSESDDDDDDDDGELTMEDMMSIANEYVTADENIIRQQSSTRDSEQEIQLQSKASSSNVSSSFDDPQTSERIESHQKSGSSFSSCDGLSNKEAVPSISTTGDPAQDMLNVFLGPLLNKPIEEEKKHKSFTEDMPFVSQYRINSQNNASSGASSSEQIVTLMKKKSSLKDKVAMLLD